MPMIGRAYTDGVNVVTRDELSKIIVRFAIAVFFLRVILIILIHHIQSGLAASGIHLANCQDLSVVL